MDECPPLVPLHGRVVVICPYVRRMGLDIAGFDFAGQSAHPDDLLVGLGEGDILCFGRGPGEDVLLSSFARDHTSGEHDHEGAGRPGLVFVSCLV